jgi:AAA domain-containing protein
VRLRVLHGPGRGRVLRVLCATSSVAPSSTNALCSQTPSRDRWATCPSVGSEQQTIDRMLNGKAHKAPLASPQVQQDIARDFAHLNPTQQDVVRVILNSQDTIVALDELAGTGKTTALAAIRAGAEASGYVVEGIAPTTSAAKELAKSGMVTQTLQRHVRLAENGTPEPWSPLLRARRVELGQHRPDARLASGSRDSLG